MRRALQPSCCGRRRGKSSRWPIFRLSIPTWPVARNPSHSRDRSSSPRADVLIELKHCCCVCSGAVGFAHAPRRFCCPRLKYTCNGVYIGLRIAMTFEPVVRHCKRAGSGTPRREDPRADPRPPRQERRHDTDTEEERHMWTRAANSCFFTCMDLRSSRRDAR